MAVAATSRPCCESTGSTQDGERSGPDPVAAHRGGAVLSLLLDTTFSHRRRARRHSLDDLIADDDDTAIAAVTAAELLVGAWLATGRRRAARQAFADAVVAAVPVIGYDVRVGRAHARLLTAARQSGRPRGRARPDHRGDGSCLQPYRGDRRPGRC